MEYIAGILAILFLVQTGLFLKYQRQVKDICRQLAFLLKNESNMLITSDIETGGIGRLRDSLNELLSRQRGEKVRYQEKENHYIRLRFARDFYLQRRVRSDPLSDVRRDLRSEAYRRRDTGKHLFSR